MFYEGVSWAGAKQPVHSFFGGKGLGIQQGMSVWVDSPKLCIVFVHGFQQNNVVAWFITWPKRLMGLEVHHDGFKLECGSLCEMAANFELLV